MQFVFRDRTRFELPDNIVLWSGIKAGLNSGVPLERYTAFECAKKIFALREKRRVEKIVVKSRFQQKREWLIQRLKRRKAYETWVDVRNRELTEFRRKFKAARDKNSAHKWPEEKLRRSNIDWHSILPKKEASLKIRNEKNATIIAMHDVSKLTFKTIARHFGVSMHRANQIYHKAKRLSRHRSHNMDVDLNLSSKELMRLSVGLSRSVSVIAPELDIPVHFYG